MNPDKAKLSVLLESAASGLSVDKWNPPFSGDIDILVKANGDWHHEGVKFTRHSLVKLFSSILKKEGDDFFLVSPVEKWKITVEDAPLLVTGMDLLENVSDQQQQKIQFNTLTDDVFFLDQEHPLRIYSKKNNPELKPYVLVRDNLEALLHRNVYYQLTSMAVKHKNKQGVWSSGVFFPLE